MRCTLAAKQRYSHYALRASSAFILPASLLGADELQKKEILSNFLSDEVRKMGLEPTRCTHHKILSLARLPVPTLPRIPD